jgi:hypothetical protein
MAKSKKLRLGRLKLENYMGIECVDLRFDTNHIVLAGSTGSGKTSYCRGVEWALKGKRVRAQVPIRVGADRARAAFLICDKQQVPVLTAERVDDGEREKLRVRFAGESADAKRPQEVLDALYSNIALRPMRLESLLEDEPAKFAEELRKLVGLDVSDLEDEHKRIAEERLLVGRERDRAEGSAQTATRELQAMAGKPKPFPGAAAEELSVVALASELEQAQAHNRANQAKRDLVTRLNTTLLLASTRTAEAAAKVARLESELEKARREHTRIEEEERDLVRERQEALTEANQTKDIDTDHIRLQLRNAEGTNEQVRANRDADRALTDKRGAADKLLDAWETKKVEYESLTAKLRDREQQKRERIAESKWPVEGLGFGEDGTATYRGLPLLQASAGERYRVYVAIAAARDPDLELIILEDGVRLDQQARLIWDQIATERDVMILEESHDTSIPGCVVISGGRVKESAKVAQ